MRDVIIHSKSPRLKMWAAACLKRLLSDFHNTPDGTWETTHEQKSSVIPKRKCANERMLEI